MVDGTVVWVPLLFSRVLHLITKYMDKIIIIRASTPIIIHISSDCRKDDDSSLVFGCDNGDIVGLMIAESFVIEGVGFTDGMSVDSVSKVLAVSKNVGDDDIGDKVVGTNVDGGEVTGFTRVGDAVVGMKVDRSGVVGDMVVGMEVDGDALVGDEVVGVEVVSPDVVGNAVVGIDVEANVVGLAVVGAKVVGDCVTYVGDIVGDDLLVMNSILV